MNADLPSEDVSSQWNRDTCSHADELKTPRRPLFPQPQLWLPASLYPTIARWHSLLRFDARKPLGANGLQREMA